MKTRSELKSESKELLKGHWGKAILLNIIPIAGSIISNRFNKRQRVFGKFRSERRKLRYFDYRNVADGWRNVYDD